MEIKELERLKKYSFEIGPIRPPSEGGAHSLLLRVTRNCPWNLCKFCYGTFYNREKFQLRTIEEIKKDIITVRMIKDDLVSSIQKLGKNIVGSQLYLYPNPSVLNVYYWINSGAYSAFLQDADSLIMRTKELLEIVKFLKQTFPSIKRITSYARSKTLAQKTKSLNDLKSLRMAGLTRLHVGLETGDDKLLKFINKGVTSDEHIIAGKKVMKAKIELSEYVMPGLGGKEMMQQHAKNTARVLNKINPNYIRLRPYVPRVGTPLFKEYVDGKFQLTSPHERLREIKQMIINLNIESRLCFDHFMNSWYRDITHSHPLFRRDFEGYKLPEEKTKVLELIDIGLNSNELVHIHVKELMEMPYL
jgi:radical SAM superfamily enzyme YgiQ (UPF0313 family)